MEWLDDVPKWRQGDAAAAERLREYVTPFVHGALVARLPHHVANQKTPETLDQVLSTPGLLKQDAQLVQHAVTVARRLAARTRVASQQERPNPDSTRNEGRQWLERVRTLPEEVRERVVWRLVWGVPGPELCEVLDLDPTQLKAELERGVGDSMTPRQSLAGAQYLWDLSGEPSTALARTETYAMALRFDPLEPPESAEAAFTAATFQDLTDAVVTETNVRPEANPFGDFLPTRVAPEPRLPPEPRSGGRLPPAGFPADEKTQGAYDLPAAARGLVPKPDPQPSPKSASRPGLPPSPPPERKREPARTTKLFEDDRPPKKRAPTEGRKETMEAPAAPSPAQTRVDDDERPSRSKLQVRGRVEGETSGRKKNPEVEARRGSKPVDTAPNAPAVAKSEVTPIGVPSEPSLEPTDPESAPKGRMPVVTERLTPQPVTPAARYVLIGVVGMSLLLAILWRLGVFA
ncbi:MAG: hypothetical protein MUC96_00990 [Myxococcaceae bacterium]|nr:hypothetical protein [Myxococcaceae bacterium]